MSFSINPFSGAPSYTLNNNPGLLISCFSPSTTLTFAPTNTNTSTSWSGPSGVISGTTSVVALLLENGHVKSTQINPPTVFTYSVSGGVSSATYSLTNGTDVKGSLLAVITTTGMINAGGYLTLKVSFNKLYTVVPTVVVTPTSDQGSLSYFVSNVGTNAFNLTIKNNTGTNIIGTSQPFNFNYFVIE